MLLNFLNNVKNIGACKRAAPYWARLTSLDDHVRALDTLQQADVTAIIEIEVACQRAKMIARQEEFRRQEEIWTAKIGSF